MRKDYWLVVVLLFFLGPVSGQAIELDVQVFQKWTSHSWAPSFPWLPSGINEHYIYDPFLPPSKKIRQCGGALRKQSHECQQFESERSLGDSENQETLEPDHNEEGEEEDEADINRLLVNLGELAIELKNKGIKLVLNISLEALLLQVNNAGSTSFQEGPLDQFYVFLQNHSDNVIWVLNSNRPHCSHFDQYTLLEATGLNSYDLKLIRGQKEYCTALSTDAGQDQTLRVYFDNNITTYIPAPDALIAGGGRHIELNRKHIELIDYISIQDINKGLNTIVKQNHQYHSSREASGVFWNGVYKQAKSMELKMFF